MKAGVPVDAMNAELKAAGLFVSWPDTPDHSRLFDELNRNHAGSLEPVEVKKVRGTGDVLAFGAGIYMGLGCSLHVTALVYDRVSHSRIAVVNADHPGSSYAFRLSGLDAGPESVEGQRLIATGWVISNCTSTWNGKRVRIDSARAGGSHDLLVRDLTAQDRGPEVEDVSARVERDVVTFLYQGATGDGMLLSEPSILRYRVAKQGLIREAPVELTRAGFIHDWLSMDDSDVSRWSEPAAVIRRKTVATALNEHGFDWVHIGVCNGLPPVWEVAVRQHDSHIVYVFRIRGLRATEMRMGSSDETHFWLPSRRYR